MTGIPRINRTLVTLALLIAALCGGQLAADARLRPDWNDMVAAAANHGLILSGAPDAGWTGFTVTDATVTGAPFLPNVTIQDLTLRRPVWNLFRLTVTWTRPVTLIFPDGRQLDLWSRSVCLVPAAHGWQFGGDGIGAGLHGGGPDDVASLEDLHGDLADTSDGWRLSVRAQDVTLPAHGTWPNGRLVEHMAATLQIGTATDPAAPAPVELKGADISWAGQRGRFSFRGSLDDGGLLAGGGEVVLGPGWAATLKRAHAARAISAGETEAAIGFLGLLAPDDRLPVSFPVTVEVGRVRVGRSTLFVLPAFPVAR